MAYYGHLSAVIDGGADVNTKNHLGTRAACGQNDRFLGTKISTRFDNCYAQCTKGNFYLKTVNDITTVAEGTGVGPRAYDELLLQAGSDVNLRNRCIETIIRVKTDVNSRSRKGETALMMAVRNGDENLIAGADVNIRAYNGDTVIRSILRPPLKLVDNLKLVYYAGTRVNMVVVGGNFVVRNRDKIYEILKLMFVAGENIDQDGYTAMQVKRELNLDSEFHLRHL